MSQRHISFLENGRSNPTRPSISLIGEALNMPAAEVDALLLSAGFAARSSDNRWSADTRAAVDASIAHVLAGHEPYPAVSVDRIWNLKNANLAAQNFFMHLGGATDPNLLRQIMTPGNIRSSINNWQDTTRALYRMLALEAARRPNDLEAAQLLEELRGLPGVVDALSVPTDQHPAPVLTMQFKFDEVQLNVFSLIATVGMSADAVVDDLRIETLLPADDVTREWFTSIATTIKTD